MHGTHWLTRSHDITMKLLTYSFELCFSFYLFLFLQKKIKAKVNGKYGV